jgi:hypothetical protein
VRGKGKFKNTVEKETVLERIYKKRINLTKEV